MPRYDQETAIAAAEVQQLILEWGHELDINAARNITDLCTQDCIYYLAGKPHTGHDAIKAFYAARNERVATLQKDGVRTQRHAISNLRVSFPEKDKAAIGFIIVNYSKEGKPPAFDLVGPTIVADCKMEARIDTDSEWRISMFDSAPVFIGNDPFLNASVVKKD
jgi:hypothetical protein